MVDESAGGRSTDEDVAAQQKLPQHREQELLSGERVQEVEEEASLQEEEELYELGQGDKDFSNHNVHLLVIQADRYHWAEIFRGTKLADGRGVHVTQCGWDDLDVTSEPYDHENASFAASRATSFPPTGAMQGTTTNTTRAIAPNKGLLLHHTKTGKMISPPPDFVLIRNEVRTSHEDHRNKLFGLFHYGGLETVNSLRSVYSFLERPVVFGELVQLQRKVTRWQAMVAEAGGELQQSTSSTGFVGPGGSKNFYNASKTSAAAHSNSPGLSRRSSRPNSPGSTLEQNFLQLSSNNNRSLSPEPVVGTAYSSPGSAPGQLFRSSKNSSSFAATMTATATSDQKPAVVIKTQSGDTIIRIPPQEKIRKSLMRKQFESLQFRHCAFQPHVRVSSTTTVSTSTTTTNPLTALGGPRENVQFLKQEQTTQTSTSAASTGTTNPNAVAFPTTAGGGFFQSQGEQQGEQTSFPLSFNQQVLEVEHLISDEELRELYKCGFPLVQQSFFSTHHARGFFYGNAFPAVAKIGGVHAGDGKMLLEDHHSLEDFRSVLKMCGGHYCTVEPYVADTAFDVRIQVLDQGRHIRCFRKVSASGHWKANVGLSKVVELGVVGASEEVLAAGGGAARAEVDDYAAPQSEIPLRYLAWGKLVATELFGGLDICTIDLVVGEDDQEYILEVNGTSSGFFPGRANEDNKVVRDLVVRRMNQVFCGKDEQGMW